MRFLRVLLLSGLLIAQPAAAHTSVVSTSPAANEVLTQVPTQVTITTAEEVRDMGSAITVTSPSGQRVDDGSTEVQGTTVLVGLIALTETGDYKVDYRLLAQDGHAIQDSYSFTLSEVSPTPTVTNSEEPVPEPSNGSLQWLTIATVAVALVALLLLVRRMRR